MTPDLSWMRRYIHVVRQDFSRRERFGFQSGPLYACGAAAAASVGSPHGHDHTNAARF